VITKKDKHIAAAQKYLERGNFEKALTEFQSAVKEDHKDTRTWLRMAEIYVRLGQTDKATEVYQRTVDLYVEQGFFQRAVAVYKNIIKLSPGLVEVRIKLADVFRQLGLLSDAMQQLEQAATLYQAANRGVEALAALKQVIDLNPEQPNPHIRYADLAAQSGATKEAAAELAEAARLLKTQGRIDEFVRVAERVLHYEPDNRDLAIAVTVQYLENNNPRAALSRIKPVFETNQRDPEVLDLLARTFEQLGQHHKTLPVLKELTRVYAEAGRLGERDQTAQRVLAIDPNDADMAHMLEHGHGGAVKRQVAQPPAAPAQVEPPLPVAAPRRPMNVTFSEMEVPASLRSRYSPPTSPLPVSMSERISIASGLVEKSQDDPEVQRVLAEADVFVRYGLVDRAADHLRRVFERVPTHQGAHERLAAVLVELGRKTEAAAEYETLAQQFQLSKPQAALDYARKAIDLNPSAQRALEVARATSGAVPENRSPSGEGSISMELHMRTPEPDLIHSDEIELLSDGVEPEEFGDTSTLDGLPDPRLSAVRGEGDPGGDGELLEVEAQIAETPFDPAQSGLASELAQVDFLIDQGLGQEATEMLDELEGRYPASGRAAINERRHRIDAPSPPQYSAHGAVPERAHAGVDTGQARVAAAVPRPAPERQDAETHVDLGIMEKTMERYAQAIEHFKAVLADPRREVFALSMIGECHEALGDPAEAIRCYQDALRRPSASEAEATQLYYQLGIVFSSMGDRSEALYYFERVSKRDPSYRDVQQRLATVRGRAGAPS
jgi:tetratricopeptide (TPR) repeat protein